MYFKNRFYLYIFIYKVISNIRVTNALMAIGEISIDLPTVYYPGKIKIMLYYARSINIAIQYPFKLTITIKLWANNQQSMNLYSTEIVLYGCKFVW